MKKALTIIAAAAASLLFIKLLLSDCDFLAKASANMKLDSATTSKTVPADYLRLFKDPGKLVIDGSDESKRRNAVSKFYYDKKYFIEVYKLDAANHLPLCKMIREKFEDRRMSPGMDYNECAGDAQFAVEYLSRPKQKVSNIYFTLYGDSTRALRKNDTMAYYYSNFQNFSLSSAQNQPEDIYGHMKDDFTEFKTPLELLFLKRKRNVYFILMGSQNNTIPLGRNALCDLIAAR